MKLHISAFSEAHGGSESQAQWDFPFPPDEGMTIRFTTSAGAEAQGTIYSYIVDVATPALHVAVRYT